MENNKLLNIKELQSVCEQHDSIRLKLNWDLLQVREEDDPNNIFHYEDGTLVGFLGLYRFGSKVELCGMVHPDYRRKGIFSALVENGLQLCNCKNYKKILLNTPQNSISGQEFLKTLPCEYSITEYQMKWSPRELSDFDGVTVRKSVSEADYENEVQLDIQSFGFSEEDALEFNKSVRKEGNQNFYVIDFEGKTVGKIRVEQLDKEAWIYGFAVFPEMQGRGIGRKALKQVTWKQHIDGYDVFLEVEANNANALRLYQSCGYEAYQAQDYFTYKA